MYLEGITSDRFLLTGQVDPVPKETEAKIATLTSLRFFAAALILLHHGSLQFDCLKFARQHMDMATTAQGVTFFFVLSGFILSLAKSTTLNTGNVHTFLVSRFARIWPLHLTTLIAKASLFPAFCLAPGAPLAPVLLANLAMVHALVPRTEYYLSYNAPSWSISTEFFFYLLFPLLVFAQKKRSWMPLLISLTGLVSCIAFCALTDLPKTSWFGPNQHGMLYISPIARLFEFTVGMSVAALYSKKVISLIGNRKGWTALEFLAIGLVIALLILNGHLSSSVEQLPLIGTPLSHWIRFSGLPIIGFGALILVMAAQKGHISRILQAPVFVLLGEISFSIYLCQGILFSYYALYLPGKTTVFDLFTFCSALLIISHLLYTIVEKPWRRLIVSGFTRKSAQRTSCKNWKIPAAIGVECLLLLLWLNVARPANFPEGSTAGRYRQFHASQTAVLTSPNY